MLVWTDVAGDSRVRKEAATLAAAGHTVEVIGRDVPDDFAPPDGVTVMSVARGRGLAGATRRTATQPLGRLASAARWLLLPRHITVALAAWTRGAEQLAATRTFDVVHAHDFSTLPLAARLADRFGTQLVYDSHEAWSYRTLSGRPTPIQRRRERRSEQRLGARCAAVITVGESIADLLRTDYGWRHVRVVRNTFPLGSLDETAPRPDASPTGAVYAGRIGPHRELTTVAAAAPRIAPVTVTVVGPADPTYLAAVAADFAAGEVTVRESLPLPELDRVVAEAGLALVTLADAGMNHRLALPNKLFHAVGVGVPVVATDLPELRRMVTRYGLGTLYRPGDPASLAEAVAEAVGRYPELRENVLRARPELSWDVDAAVLREVYAGLTPTSRASAASVSPTNSSPKILMMVLNGIVGDSRVQKAAWSAANAGYDVTLLGIAPPGAGKRGQLGAARVILASVSESGPLARRWRRLRFGVLRRIHRLAVDPETVGSGWRGALGRLLWRVSVGDASLERTQPEILAVEAAMIPIAEDAAPDLIHAHDYTAVPVAVRIAARLRAAGRDVRVLYDAHEYLPGVRGHTAVWRRSFDTAERWAIARADAVITVSEPLAELLVDRHQLPEKPAVVTNAPLSWRSVSEADAEAPSLRHRLGLGADVPLLVYVGGVAPQRGVITMVEALLELPGVHAAVVAKPGRWVMELEHAARRLGVTDRFHITSYVASHLVSSYVASATIGVIPILHYVNHEIALITKYYEYLHARLPIVTSDVKTMAEYTRTLGNGEVFTAGDPSSLAAAVRAILADRQRYITAYTDDVVKGHEWPQQAEVLEQVYERLLGSRTTLARRSATFRLTGLEGSEQ
jgi:glycogen synthase